MIYCDGACSGNPGPGGWGAIVVTPHLHVRELGGGAIGTTNNKMELTAGIEALRAIKSTPGPVIVYTDSTYVIRGITQWVWGWLKRGWKTAEGAEVQNRDLWQELHRIALERKGVNSIRWKYVRGHSGIVGNERCDEIAVSFSKGLTPRLFDGGISEYALDLLTPPREEPLPEMKNHRSADKPKVHSYVSSIGGIAMTHTTWAECERRVKGQAGAKFKKAISPEDEDAILRSWGIDPNKSKRREGK
jgi:ribonuclease HI